MHKRINGAKSSRTKIMLFDLMRKKWQVDLIGNHSIENLYG